MRSSKSRSRSKANRPRTLGNIINRVFDSSGPEGKVRGTPQQIIEKYLFLARDAQLSNDRVAAENFLQHAEHYTRLLGEAQREMAAEQEARQQQFQQNAPNRDGNRDQNRDGNGNGNGNREGFRDRGDRRDGGDFRQDQREPRFDAARSDFGASEAVDVASGAEVIDLSGDDDAGLVETPEAFGERPASAPADLPMADAPRPAPRAEKSDRPARPERTPRADRAPKAEAQPATTESVPADLPTDQPGEKADRGPRRPRGPRKPKPEGTAETKPEAAE